MTEEKTKPLIYVGVKWGLQNPAVMLAARFTPKPINHILVFRELYQKEIYLEDLIDTAKAWNKEMKIKKIFCDPTQPEFIKRLRKERLWAVPVENEWMLAVNMVKRRLFQVSEAKKAALIAGDKKFRALEVPGGLTVGSGCTNLPREFNLYHAAPRQPNKPFRDKPVEMDNYALSALHFLVVGLSTEKTPMIRWI